MKLSFGRLGAAAAAALALALAFASGGCATVPEEPFLEAGLANLRFTDVKVFETVALLDIRLDNISPEAVEVTGASHRVSVNGVKLGRGQTGESLAVPRLGSAMQVVEFHLRNYSMARTIHDLGRHRSLDYELESTLYVRQSNGRDRAVRLKRSGRLDLPAGVSPDAGR